MLVGGGDIALRKARFLFAVEAQVHIVTLALCDELKNLADQHGGTYRLGPYQDEDLDDLVLVVAATDNQPLNEQISRLAQQKNIPVNVVDNPPLCSVILPAIIDRSPIVVSISSGGKSPVLARMIRSQIESMVPAAYGKLSAIAGSFRDRLKARMPDVDDRKNFWEDVLQGPIAEMVYSGKPEVAEKMLAEKIDTLEDPQPQGEVYLVGAGPGDPDLLTFKALRLMQKADVVLYDRLVASEIVDLTRRDAERIYVGKRRADHAVPQEGINQLLVKYASQGKRVLRLKGGDPFIFGRGGEEIEELAEHNIPFQVVPGITAASGCASYAGIPLTHRDYAQSVRFVTGHLKNGTSNLPWDELVHTGQTLVFYMGLVGLRDICSQLIANGRSAETPIAIIQQGTTANQRVVTGTLATMPDQVEQEKIKAPTLLIVGEVVELRDKLAWFEMT